MKPLDSLIDPVTLEVVKHKLWAVPEEQAITMKSVSGSPIVTEANDFNTGLYLADGSIVKMSHQVILHAGSMSQVIKYTLQDCRENPGIEDGDMFIVNDPYKGALHPPDVSIVAPIFVDGQLFAWVGACAHQIDVGGMDPGSWCSRATERLQEAMVIPPVKLVERGKVRNDIWNMILSMSRLPFMVGLDLRAMIAANNVAKRRFLEVTKRYGGETVQRVMEELIQFSERQFRERLRNLPDGIFRAVDFLDHDGHENRLYKVAVDVIKEGDHLVFDFSNTSEQAPGFINCTESGLIGGVCTGVFTILAYEIPWTEGLLKPIEIVAPEGTLCNARPPAPNSMSSVAGTHVVENVLISALSKLVQTREEFRSEAQGVSRGGVSVLTLSGKNQYDEPFGTYLLDASAGGGGAHSFRDGLHATGSYHNPTPNIANVETNENFSPILYLHRKLIPDSGGPGNHRGGLACGLAFTLHDVEEINGVLVSHGVQVPNSAGIFGGFPGSCIVNGVFRESDVWAQFEQGQSPSDCADLDAHWEILGAKPGRIKLQRNDVLEYTWQGGGGYGDPLDREPERVARDVARGWVSSEAARAFYGVVLEEGAPQVDYAATETERESIRRKRLRNRADNFRPHLSSKKVKVIHPLGCALQLIEEEGKNYVLCEKCEHLLGPASENWKSQAARAIVPAESVGPLIQLHEELEIREFSCPNCGTLLSLDIARKEDPDLFDIEIRTHSETTRQ
jgi:N-methylhydantoinase B